MLNISLKKFKINHKKKLNQILYLSLDSDGSKEIINLINNFFTEKNAFVFESVEKGFIKGRYTIFGKNPDKIWEFNNSISKIYFNNKVKILKGSAKKNIENVIESFKFKIPKELPSISSIISGYFSYDIIRYLENIPNKNKDDLKLPDARIIRPRELIIHDNIKKKLYFIINVFCDEKINNYKNRYEEIINQIENLIFLSNYNSLFIDKINKKVKTKVKSNISKQKFLSNVKKAKKYIKIGDIFQVVLSQRFETKLSKNPIEIYKKLGKQTLRLLCIFLILKIFR